MRLWSATTALLGLQVTGARLLPFLNRSGVIVEKASASGDFEHYELQQRSSGFLNNLTIPFAVNGSGLPNITWDVGESYAGLLPITSDKDETRKLFFWFFPSYSPNPKNEIVVWLNGGPGCSSMEGLLTENGPINWLAGTEGPTTNPFTWLNLTNMVWVDQPLGVGYSQGFWKNFVKLFCMEDWRMYLTGESYAGVYIPYIADAFINSDNPTYFNLAGVHLSAAVIGDGNLQMNVPLASYAQSWNNVLGLNDTHMTDLQRRADECGLTRYIHEQLSFPPPKTFFRQLVWQNDSWAAEQCDMSETIRAAAQLVNPCFNVYHITDACPWLLSSIGFSSAQSSPGSSDRSPWFSQPSVRAALHVPHEDEWKKCAQPGVFRNRTDGTVAIGDPYSAPPATTNLFSRMIEYTSNVVIGSGGLDMLIPSNGTLLVLQNVTWGDVPGFQQRPARPFFSPYPIEPSMTAFSMAGLVGTWERERGLTFYEVSLAGHELPRYAPGPSLRAMELLLGRISSLDEIGNFTTQSTTISSGPSQLDLS